MSGLEESDWQQRAQELFESGDLPERRSQVVALIEAGYTHSEVADERDILRSNVAQHVRRYRNKDLQPAQWLVENAPEI